MSAIISDKLTKNWHFFFKFNAFTVLTLIMSNVVTIKWIKCCICAFFFNIHYQVDVQPHFVFLLSKYGFVFFNIVTKLWQIQFKEEKRSSEKLKLIKAQHVCKKATVRPNLVSQWAGKAAESISTPWLIQSFFSARLRPQKHNQAMERSTYWCTAGSACTGPRWSRRRGRTT